MSRAPVSIAAAKRVAEALREEFGPAQRHRGYPVVGADGVLLGMLDRAQAQAAAPDATLGQLYGANPPPFALAGETCRSVAARMAMLDVERLPVVADAHSRTLTGIISRSDLVKPGKDFFEHEEQRERHASLTPWRKPKPRMPRGEH